MVIIEITVLYLFRIVFNISKKILMVLNVRLIAFMQNIIFIFLFVFYLFDGLCQICLAGVIKNNKIEVSLYLNIVFRA